MTTHEGSVVLDAAEQRESHTITVLAVKGGSVLVRYGDRALTLRTGETLTLPCPAAEVLAGRYTISS